MERIAILNLQGVFQQDAEKEISMRSPLKGSRISKNLTASLKRCPDTNPPVFENRLHWELFTES
jgi:hypothetical protein